MPGGYARGTMSTHHSPTGHARSWVMLLALTAAFAMSQAFRTVGAILATPLQAEFHLSPQQLGTFAGSFHFAFGAMQLLVGIGIDLHGVRRTVLTGFPLAIAGAVLSAVAPTYGTLVLGQILIGVGCAPAFLVCTVFIARHFAADRFAAISGAVLSIGGIGLLATGTPLAWLVKATSWRMGFWVLAGCSAVAWWLIAWKVHEPRPREPTPELPRESLGRAALTFVSLFRLPYTPGIVALFLCLLCLVHLAAWFVAGADADRTARLYAGAKRQRGAGGVGGVADQPGIVRSLRPRGRNTARLADRLDALDGSPVRFAGVGAQRHVRRGDDADGRHAVGLHDPAVFRGAHGLPGAVRRPRAGPVHDVDVPRRRGDAMVHRPGRLDGQGTGRRHLRGSADRPSPRCSPSARSPSPRCRAHHARLRDRPRLLAWITF